MSQKLRDVAPLQYITQYVGGKLDSQDMREILELPLDQPFTVRAALLCKHEDLPAERKLTIALYDETEVWGPTGKMNPIKGFLYLRKGLTRDSQ